ncbi:MAG: hypothetical protein ACOZHQ_13960 [Thermodesulfobacteriota bacterium]
MSTEILPQGGLDVLLRALHLPSFLHHHQEVAEVARREGQDYLQAKSVKVVYGDRAILYLIKLRAA